MKRRVLCVLIAMLLFGCARGELLPDTVPETIVPESTGETETGGSGEELYSLLLPIIDEQVSADLIREAPELAGSYLGFRPVTSQMNAEGDAIILMGDLYRAEAQIDTLSPEAFARVNWLDRRGVVVLRRDQSALLGWSMESMTYDDTLQMEDMVAVHFAETMTPWVSADGACSLQYPAMFGTLTPQQDADGRTGEGAALADGSASFFVGCRPNTQGETIISLDEALRKAEPTADLARNDATGVLRITRQKGSKMQADLYLPTQDMVYHAVMTWDVTRNVDFLRYSDYVMNSFSADELGVG